MFVYISYMNATKSDKRVSSRKYRYRRALNIQRRNYMCCRTCSQKYKEYKELKSHKEVLQDMQEQVGKLTALLQDERRSHQQRYHVLLDEAEHKAEKCRQHHQLEMEQLMQEHRSEMSKLIQTLEDERKSAEERYALLKKDYDFLKGTFTPYKDSVFDDNNCSKGEQERCLKKQLLWLKEQLNQSEAEREMQRKAFQSENAEHQANFKAEAEGLKRKLKEKDVTISLLRTALHQIQKELNTMMCHLSELGKGLEQHPPAQMHQ